MVASRQWTTLFAGLAMLGSLAPAAPAGAQVFAAGQTVRVIVPNPPGGLPDVIARIVVDRLRERLPGPTWVVENKPGANTGIGIAQMTSAKPDGLTLIVTDGAAINLNPLINSQLLYNPKDLAPVVLVARAPLFIAAGTKVAANNLQELAALAKANPGKLSVGTIGVGSFHHVTMEAVMVGLGIKFNHVPFKGSGETVAAMRGGHLDLVIAAYPGLLAAVKAGQAKLIAANSPKRAVFASDVPAIAESIPGFDLAVIQGFYARTGSPADVINRLAEAAALVVKEPEVVQKFTAAGIEPAAAGPAEFAGILAAEGERVAKVVKAAGIKPE